MRDRVNATNAGYINHVSTEFWSDLLFLAHTENPAPIIGPSKKPIEKAIPIRAIPLFRVLGVDISVIIAVDNVTLPLASPPEIKKQIFGVNKHQKYWDFNSCPYYYIPFKFLPITRAKTKRANVEAWHQTA